MCGIALNISGIELDLSLLDQHRDCRSSQVSPLSLFSEEDIKAALQRRGPDSIGAIVVSVHSSIPNDERNDFVLQTFLHGGGVVQNGVARELHGELLFIGATLQLRGVSPVTQPLTDALQNVLVYNGEIFGGIHVSSDSSDTKILMQSLGRCCSCLSHDGNRSPSCSGRSHESVPELLSRIRGPWALIYWQDSSKTLWFGRDAFGRRSLLVHWPTSDDKRLLLSSVLQPSSMQQSHDDLIEIENFGLNGWEELPCGVYSTTITISPLRTHGYLIGEVKRHEWTDIELKKLMTWERTSIEPIPGNLSVSVQKVPTMQEGILPSISSEIESSGFLKSAPTETSHKVLMVLKESVMRRTNFSRIYQGKSGNHERDIHSPIALLFSGGLDSMIIAALVHQCIDSEYEIDLLNVSFDGEMAPDRISARTGFKELQKIAPSRRWNLVEIDANLQKLRAETKHVMALINPANTYMDLNIGLALWLAAGGDGWLYEETSSSSDAENKCIKYKSEARILLVGSGADEQCAGYGRHRTKFRNKSWLGLHEEMKLDMQRIWKRNLGRDDRCITDNAKEARFPFLDEDVIRTLLEIPLWEIANLHLPSGTGDKMILREVARLLGLNNAATQPKRAIQFGSRIARESNRKNFGSNRAANQASAGSAVIHGLSA